MRLGLECRWGFRHYTPRPSSALVASTWTRTCHCRSPQTPPPTAVRCPLLVRAPPRAWCLTRGAARGLILFLQFLARTVARRTGDLRDRPPVVQTADIPISSQVRCRMHTNASVTATKMAMHVLVQGEELCGTSMVLSFFWFCSFSRSPPAVGRSIGPTSRGQGACFFFGGGGLKKKKKKKKKKKGKKNLKN